MHPKFDLTRVLTHDLQIMTVYFMSLIHNRLTIGDFRKSLARMWSIYTGSATYSARIVANTYFLLICCGDRMVALCFIRSCLLFLPTRSIVRQFGSNVGRLTLALLLLSTGMFVASTAFLPSTFSMYMTMVSMAAWWQGHLQIAIFATAASALIGWPFAAAIG